MEWDLIKKVLAALEREGVRYAVVGAVAINRPKDWGDAEAIKRRFNLEES